MRLLPVRKNELEEFRAVKAVFSNSEECVRTKMFATFAIDNSTGHLDVIFMIHCWSFSGDYSKYETPSGASLDRGEQYCEDCHCCTNCSLQCGNCQEVGEPMGLLERVCNLLNIDMLSDDFR